MKLTRYEIRWLMQAIQSAIANETDFLDAIRDREKEEWVPNRGDAAVYRRTEKLIERWRALYAKMKENLR